jgi:TPR repeat protein
MASAAGSPPQAAARRRGAVTIVMPGAGPQSLAADRAEFRRLRERALQRDAAAQLELGRQYAIGYVVPRDYAEAQAWLAAAAANPAAGADLRAEAADTFQQVADMMSADRAQDPGRYASLNAGASAP